MTLQLCHFLEQVGLWENRLSAINFQKYTLNSNKPCDGSVLLSSQSCTITPGTGDLKNVCKEGKLWSWNLFWKLSSGFSQTHKSHILTLPQARLWLLAVPFSRREWLWRARPFSKDRRAKWLFSVPAWSKSAHIHLLITDSEHFISFHLLNPPAAHIHTHRSSVINETDPISLFLCNEWEHNSLPQPSPPYLFVEEAVGCGL